MTSTGDNPPANPGAHFAAFSQYIGISTVFGALASQPYLYESAKLLILGSFLETIRRLWIWLVERFKLRYSITAQFDDGDPTYDWIILFLTQENVWRKSRNFIVTAKSSKRKWGISSRTETGNATDDNVDYVPAYGAPHLFRWKGHWIEISRHQEAAVYDPGTKSIRSPNSLYLTLFTLDMSVLSALVEESRRRYIEVNAPNVIIHTADGPHYGNGFEWGNVKRKHHRPLHSLILEEGVLESLLDDAREFFDMQDWYAEAGIPHHRGYLLYGPPGTGKTSTIYTLAGELGLEIYSLSLASAFVDDSFLQRAASSMPKHSILLLEDIDCAFPSREEVDEEDEYLYMQRGVSSYSPYSTENPKKANVTLSGLLNVVDGVGSEEGKLFFATTNYVDRLDPALLRPGRIDKKVEYKLATRYQARALFNRFFPESRFYDVLDKATEVLKSSSTKFSSLSDLSAHFAAAVPENEFSTAELQGYLLTWKMHPVGAALGVEEWVQKECREKQEKRERESERKRKVREAREKAQKAAERPVAVTINGQVVPHDSTPVQVPASEPSSPPGSSVSAQSFPTSPTVSTPPLIDMSHPLANGYVNGTEADNLLSVAPTPAASHSIHMDGTTSESQITVDE